MAIARMLREGLHAVPRGVWILGFVSMLMDISSEMIHALLPVYLVSVLGVSTLAVGFIEGMAEATAMFVKIFSGTLSDALGRRKWLAAFGYGLAALTKPMFPLATSLSWIVTARFIDRIGKGIRGAPRDALIADITPRHARGAAFGLRQALDTIGAVLGPLIALALMVVTAAHYQFVFWVAVVPAFIAVALIVFGVSDIDDASAPRQDRAGLVRRLKQIRTDVWRLPLSFWAMIALASVLTLARFSEAFLILRAQNLGVAVSYVPLVLIGMNVVYAAMAFPAGALSDRIGRRGLLVAATLVLIVADLVLAYASGVALLAVGVVLWGVHMGLSQSLFSALIADSAPAPVRGTAFGIFNVAGGLSLLFASVIAGAVWDHVGPHATFLVGCGFAILALVGLAMPRGRRSWRNSE